MKFAVVTFYFSQTILPSQARMNKLGQRYKVLHIPFIMVKHCSVGKYSSVYSLASLKSKVLWKY